MNPADFKRHFPKASKATLRANAEIWESAVKESSGPIVPLNIILRASTDEAKLNKTERAFLRIIRARKYPWIGVQCLTLKLGDDCRYSPDLQAVSEDGKMLCFEVKGFMRDDALVKLKVAARIFPWITFYLVTKQQGQFIEKEVNT